MTVRSRMLTFLSLALIAVPALADKLTFDHRLVPALKAVLDAGDPAMISYDDRNPRNVIDVIAVRGKSAQDWQEALIIIARMPDRKIATTADWVAQLQRDAIKKCPARFTVVAQDSNSVTFERRSAGCPAGYPPVALYRVVAGKPSLFLLAAMTKTDFSPAARDEWLAMMASARLE
jgi:Holliday junction resolvase-like predicted endonuclease